MELAVKALQLDASDFITKPIASQALMVALERAKQRFTTRKQLHDYTRFLEDGWTETTQELLQTFAYQHRLIESSMDGILGCNAQETVVTFNRSMEQMFGYAKCEVLHQKRLSHFFEPDQLERFRSTLADDCFGGPHQLFLYETPMRTRGGDSIPVQLSAAAVMQNERFDGLVCFIRDLRKIRKLEQQMADQARILHQDKMISLGRLAASVAHEINNPLSGVLNYLRLMIRIVSRQPDSSKPNADFQRYLSIAEQEIDRCSRIVGNLLIFARKSPVKNEPVVIAELIERCALLSRHRLELGRIDLVTRIGESLPTVRGDANQLQQCLINLIFNAVDAMPQGGRLELGATCSQDRHRLIITVTDNGCGIEPGNLEHIFEPFFTTKQEGHGTGLGLSTAYGIVERHGGRIEVHSRPGKGTTFTMTFPAVE
jgi:PAS domain S-box-containing protein